MIKKINQTMVKKTFRVIYEDSTFHKRILL